MAVSRAQIADQVIKEAYCLCRVPGGYLRAGRTERPSQREMHDDAWSSSGIGGAKFDRSHARKTPVDPATADKQICRRIVETGSFVKAKSCA